MGSYIPDQSGINSLGGFAYQIRLFVYYMLSMEENMSIGFEIVDDISIKTLTPAALNSSGTVESFILSITLNRCSLEIY